MKTDWADKELIARRFTTRVPVLGPQGIANGSRSTGALASHGNDFHAPISDGVNLRATGAVTPSFHPSRRICHGPNNEVLETSSQAQVSQFDNPAAHPVV